MFETVSCSSQFLKQVSQLEKAGGKALNAIKQAEQIIHHLKLKKTDPHFLRNKQTNSGENRLENIEKYDLGAGYRLVCRRNSGEISIEFIGTHDKTDQWINHHRIARSNRTAARTETTEFMISVSNKTDTEGGFSDTLDEVDLYEEKLKNRLDDKLLQQIFCGITCRTEDNRQPG